MRKGAWIYLRDFKYPWLGLQRYFGLGRALELGLENAGSIEKSAGSSPSAASLSPRTSPIAQFLLCKGIRARIAL